MASCSFSFGRIRILAFLLTWWVTDRDARARLPLPLWPCLLYHQKGLFLRWGYGNLSLRYRPLPRYRRPLMPRGRGG